MKSIDTYAKTILNEKILELEQFKSLYLKNPEVDFKRDRKWSFTEIVKFILFMSGNSISKEILDYKGWRVDSPTASSFVQQRKKLLPELFEYLFHSFSSSLPQAKKYCGYRLIACDGSDLSIARNPNDKDTFFQDHREAGFNLLHLNALFDLCNGIFVDGIVQSRKKVSEYRALWEMIDRSSISDKVIVLADRGFESYNVIAHAQEKGWNYLIRAKDIGSKGILSGLQIPSEGEFDVNLKVAIGRSQRKSIKRKYENYKVLMTNSTFDYLNHEVGHVYEIPLRVVRFKISENEYEAILTNLSTDEFSMNEIKELYHTRWGIETSFRTLKYVVGLTNFHSKKVDCIIQEIFARLTMFNLYETITTSVVIKQPESAKHIYKVNVTMAFQICKRFCEGIITEPPDVEALIKK